MVDGIDDLTSCALSRVLLAVTHRTLDGRGGSGNLISSGI